MKAITIRGIDDAVSERLRCAAKEAGKSVNQLLVEMIRREMGFEKPKRYTVEYSDLDHLFGRWSKAEFREVQGKIEAERKVDEEIWGERLSD